jgi:hypothetical protein
MGSNNKILQPYSCLFHAKQNQSHAIFSNSNLKSTQNFWLGIIMHNNSLNDQWWWRMHYEPKQWYYTYFISHQHIWVIFTFGCCILLRIYLTGSLWCRRSQQSFNTSTSLHRVAYVQRIRCIRNSPLKHPIVYLTWGWPVGAETCSEREGK